MRSRWGRRRNEAGENKAASGGAAAVGVRGAEEAESGAADVRSVKELAAVLRELTALGRALEQEEEKDETVRVVLPEEVEPWSE